MSSRVLGVGFGALYGTVLGAAAVAAGAAGAAAAAESARAVPAVAVWHGTYDSNRHQAEHDGALAQLGWPAAKYSLRETPRLVADLGRLDLVLGNPLFNYGPDVRDLGADAAAWRAFLERGGALVLTDCNYGSCVDWLARLGPALEMATAPCPGAAPAAATAPVHPLLVVPNEWAVRNSWQHLVATGPGWEVAARCGDGQAVVATQRVGKGLLVVTGLWPLRATQLENVWTALQLQRRGLAVTRFEMAPVAVGQGHALLGLRSLADGPAVTAALRLEVTLAGQAPAVTAGQAVAVSGAGEARIELAYRISGRGPARVALRLEAPPQPLTLLDRSLVLPPLLSVRLTQPSYRGLALRSAWPGAVRLTATVVPDAEPLAELSLRATLRAPDGREAARAERRPLTGGETGLELPLPAVAPGDYAVTTELVRGERVLATATATVSVLPDAPATVLIDDALRALVNGEPFFPLGMYHVGEADLPAAAALGFNTVQGWGGNLERARRFLDTARAHRLLVLLEMGGLVGETVDEAGIRAHVEAFAKHPALLAWYVRDEPGPELHESVRRAAALFRTLDPLHPTYLVSCRPSEFSEQAGLADIFAVDPYPLPGGPVSVVAQWTDQAWAATRGQRPVWIIPQAHDQSSYERQAPARGATPPTAAQQRCMTYLALVHGARGLIWYTWDDGPDMGLKFHATQQAEFRDLLREVGALAPAWLAATSRRFSAADGKVHGLIAGTGADRRLVVANAASEPVTAVIEVEEAAAGQRFRAVPDGAERTAADRRLTLELAPLAVQVYRF